MIDSDLTLIIVSITTTLNTVAALGTLYLTRKVEKSTNSMKDELVAVTRSDAKQEGITQGVADQKAKQAIIDIAIKAE